MTRKKLEGNGLWESSRMMLPEHKEQIIEHNTSLNFKSRPILDEQKLQDISELIAGSFHNGTEITIVQFNEIMDREFTGRVLEVDERLRRIKLSDPTFGFFYIKFTDINDAK